MSMSMLNVCVLDLSTFSTTRPVSIPCHKQEGDVRYYSKALRWSGTQSTRTDELSSSLVLFSSSRFVWRRVMMIDVSSSRDDSFVLYFGSLDLSRFLLYKSKHRTKICCVAPPQDDQKWCKGSVLVAGKIQKMNPAAPLSFSFRSTFSPNEAVGAHLFCLDKSASCLICS